MHTRSADRERNEIDLDRLVWDQEYRQTVKRWLKAGADESDHYVRAVHRPQSERPAA